METRTEQVIRAMLVMQRYPWEQGVCAQALYEVDREELWIPMAYDAIQRQGADGRLAMIGGEPAVSDPAANGEVCLRAYEKTGNRLFLEGAEHMLAYLMNQAPRTADGIICHNNVSFEKGFSDRQLWIDGLYMVPPFLAVMGRTKEAMEQIRGYIRHLRDAETGLFFHIVDTEQGRFVRRKRWATGNGWALLGLIRVADTLKVQGKAALQQEATEMFLSLLKAMIPYQTEDGRFHDLLDEDESFLDGTSALMMAASVFHGMAVGLIPDTWQVNAEKAYQTAGGKIDSLGLLREVCGCPDFVSAGTSAEAQAAYVMADAWRKRLYLS